MRTALRSSLGTISPRMHQIKLGSIKVPNIGTSSGEQHQRPRARLLAATNAATACYAGDHLASVGSPSWVSSRTPSPSTCHWSANSYIQSNIRAYQAGRNEVQLAVTGATQRFPTKVNRMRGTSCRMLSHVHPSGHRSYTRVPPKARAAKSYQTAAYHVPRNRSAASRSA